MSVAVALLPLAQVGPTVGVVVAALAMHEVLQPLALVRVARAPAEGAAHLLVVLELALEAVAVVPRQLAPSVLAAAGVRLALKVGKRRYRAPLHLSISFSADGGKGKGEAREEENGRGTMSITISTI
jgi:hypothetical protein